MPFLKRDIVPEVTSGETAFANVAFLLVSGHGSADLSRYMIVPENTFLFFLGASGFVRNMKRQLEKFRKLIGYTAYIPVGTVNRRNAQEAYSAAFYSTFFEGSSDALKFYPNASIYVPGDLLPDTQVSFQSGPQDVWHKGVYSLPVPPKQEREFLLEDTLMERFISDIAAKEIPITALRDAKIKDSKVAQVLNMLIMTKEARQATYGNDLDIADFFDDLDVISSHYDQEFYTLVPNNLAQTAGISMDGLYLSEIIATIPSAKPYRFFIFTACRGPSTETGLSFYTNEGAFRSNLPPVAIPHSVPKAKERQMLRRLSISARCSTRDTAPMNLKKVREAARACYQELAEKAKARALIPAAVKPAMRTTRAFFNWGKPYQYRMFVSAEKVAQYLNEILAPLVPEEFPKTRAFQAQLRETFGSLIRSLRSDLASLGSANQRSIGEVFLERSGIPIPANSPLYLEGPQWTALEGEKVLSRNLAERGEAQFRAAMDALVETFQKKVAELGTNARETLGRLKTVAEAEKALADYNQARRALDADLDAKHGTVLREFADLGTITETYRYTDMMEIMEQLEKGGTIHCQFQQFIKRAAKADQEGLHSAAAAVAASASA